MLRVPSIAHPTTTAEHPTQRQGDPGRGTAQSNSELNASQGDKLLTMATIKGCLISSLTTSAEPLVWRRPRAAFSLSKTPDALQQRDGEMKSSPEQVWSHSPG